MKILKKLINSKDVWLLTITMVLVPFTQAADMDFSHNKRSEYDLTRDKLSKGPEIVELASISKGMSVIDVFGGGGYYSEILASKVGSTGKVYLHNNQAYMPYVEKELNARLNDNRLSNVVRFDREADNLNVERNQFDAAFYILGYHDLYHKVDGWNIDKALFLKQLMPSIKKGGKLVIVDHSAKAGTNTQHSQKFHRIDKQYVIDEVSQFGYKLAIDSKLLANEKDNRMETPFTPKLRRKTDRFILVFVKEES